ncbi:MAG: dienelactone hydrolase, partial [Planctomycetaceae bacterium]|nr:dienelactone hydrolase [Planctomycetaceae bacterium]
MKRLFESSLLIQVSASSLRGDYAPLLTAKAQPEQKDLVVKDEKRSREIPIRVYLPTGQAAAPVVLFSHGL